MKIIFYTTNRLHIYLKVGGVLVTILVSVVAATTRRLGRIYQSALISEENRLISSQPISGYPAWGKPELTRWVLRRQIFLEEGDYMIHCVKFFNAA